MQCSDKINKHALPISITKSGEVIISNQFSDPFWDLNKEAIPTIPSRQSSARLWPNVCNPVKTPRELLSNSHRQLLSRRAMSWRHTLEHRTELAENEGQGQPEVWLEGCEQLDTILKAAM